MKRKLHKERQIKGSPAKSDKRSSQNILKTDAEIQTDYAEYYHMVQTPVLYEEQNTEVRIIQQSSLLYHVSLLGREFFVKAVLLSQTSNKCIRLWKPTQLHRYFYFNCHQIFVTNTLTEEY